MKNRLKEIAFCLPPLAVGFWVFIAIIMAWPGRPPWVPLAAPVVAGAVMALAWRGLGLGKAAGPKGGLRIKLATAVAFALIGIILEKAGVRVNLRGQLWGQLGELLTNAFSYIAAGLALAAYAAAAHFVGKKTRAPDV